jgi:hypothetical protein
MRLYAQRVRIDRQGYDPNGRYWGVGMPLYHVYSDDYDVDTHVRAYSALDAKARAMSRGNPGADTLLLVGLGVVGAAAVGYAIYAMTQSTAASTAASNQQATNLGTAIQQGRTADPYVGTNVAPAATTT